MISASNFFRRLSLESGFTTFREEYSHDKVNINYLPVKGGFYGQMLFQTSEGLNYFYSTTKKK